MQERDRSKRSMVFYFDWFDNFDGLEPDEVTDLLTAIRVYAQYGEHIDGINRVSARILKTMESRIDADFESWKKKTASNRENGMKGGRPRKNEITHENPQKPNGLNKNPLGPSGPHENPVAPVYEYDTEYDNGSVSEYDSETESEKEKVFEEDIGKGVQGENLQGETLEEKSDTPYRLSPADKFLLKHKDNANQEFVMLCAQRMRDYEQQKKKMYDVSY